MPGRDIGRRLPNDEVRELTGQSGFGAGGLGEIGLDIAADVVACGIDGH